MNEKELVFLQTAKTMVKDNPSLFGHLISICTQGIEEKVSLERERAADFETIAAAYMALMREGRKTPSTTEWADNVIKTKMAKWADKTSLNFKSEIDELMN